MWNDVTCYKIHIFHRSRFYVSLSDCIAVNATRLSYGSLFDKMQNSLFLNATLISPMHNVHRLYCISWKYRNVVYWSCLWLKSVLCFMLQIINEIICILKRKNWNKSYKKVFIIISYKRTSRLDIVFSPMLSSLHSFTIQHARREYKLRLYVQAY
jgi:hypothetical protein